MTQLFDFGHALDHLRKGAKVQREGWNGKGLWLELQQPDAHSKMTLPYLFLSYPDDAAITPGARVPWLASQTDLLAHDWCEVGNPAAAVATLEWSPTLCDGNKVDYAAAEKACAALGAGWRLPSRMELESILDLTRHKPAVDPDRFPDTKSDWYWTSTPCAWAPSCAWFVVFLSGYALSFHRSGSACVRAVRSVSAGQ